MANRLAVLGSSGGAPNRTNPASGYLLTTEHEDTTLWLDAGTGTFMALAGRMDPGWLTGVVVSHTHVDHCADLFGLYAYLAFGPSGTVPIPVYLPVGGAAHLAAFARAEHDHVFHAVLDLIEVGPGDEVTVGDARVRFGAAVHSVPGVVTRVETPEGVVTYSGDTGPDSDLVALAAGSDLLLCEASLTGVRHPGTYPYHLTAGEAGAAAAAAGVGRLVVTHLGIGVDPAIAVNEARAAFSGEVEVARPGEQFVIGAE